MRVFGRFFKVRQRVTVVKADSAAALGAAMKLDSPRPSMNFAGAELPLPLEREDIAELEGEHLPGKFNVCSDFLSRVMMENLPPKPPALAVVKVQEISKRIPFILEGSGPGRRPGLWGREGP